MHSARVGSPFYRAPLGLIALALLGACGTDPVSVDPAVGPSRAVTAAASSALTTTPAGIVLAPGETYWDFVDLNRSPTAPGTATNPDGRAFESYASRTVTNGALGSITLTTDRPTGDPQVVGGNPFRVDFKWAFDDERPMDEKGVGVCPVVRYGGIDLCENPSEVGEGSAVKLLMDMSQLAPGVPVKALVISSLQTGESYTFALCTTATAGCRPSQSGVGVIHQPVVRVDIAQGTSKWVQFMPNQVDYLVAGIVTGPAPVTLLNDQGCSPGYWKNHSAWPAPYSPNTKFSAVFENAFPGKTMQEVLSAGGGGLTALGRQTVSALLNATELGTSHYGLSTQQVIDKFNAAYPGSNYDALTKEFESRTDVGGRVCKCDGSQSHGGSVSDDRDDDKSHSSSHKDDDARDSRDSHDNDSHGWN